MPSLKFLKAVITRSHDHIVIKIKKLTVKTKSQDHIWYKECCPSLKFLKAVITKSLDHIWSKECCPPWNFWKLWSQNHVISYDLKIDAFFESFKTVITKSQDITGRKINVLSENLGSQLSKVLERAFLFWSDVILWFCDL